MKEGFLDDNEIREWRDVGAIFLNLGSSQGPGSLKRLSQGCELTYRKFSGDSGSSDAHHRRRTHLEEKNEGQLYESRERASLIGKDCLNKDEPELLPTQDSGKGFQVNTPTSSSCQAFMSYWCFPQSELKQKSEYKETWLVLSTEMSSWAPCKKLRHRSGKVKENICHHG